MGKSRGPAAPRSELFPEPLSLEQLSCARNGSLDFLSLIDPPDWLSLDHTIHRGISEDTRLTWNLGRSIWDPVSIWDSRPYRRRPHREVGKTTLL
jgi:hypothetical protein